jgi:leucyl aminopeptidase
MKNLSGEVLAISLRKDQVAEGLSFLGEVGESLASVAEKDSFTGKAGESKIYPSMGLVGTDWLILAGSGSGTGDELRQAAGAVGSIARRKGFSEVQFYNSDESSSAESNRKWTDEDVHVSVTGFRAGNYIYDRFKDESDKKPAASTLALLGEGSQEAADKGQSFANGRELARDLVNAPAAVIYPQTLADEALALASDCITVEVWDEKKLEEERMGGIIAVGQGSVQKPRFIHLHYKPEGEASRSIALVGKGVTFDAGGLSMKSSAGMQTMRCDMAGSAAVLGTFKALAALKPSVEVHGLIGAAENMVANNSYKLGDILTMRNGKTVEVHNTDAEGRLVMADCLCYGSELGVDQMLDIATLTGACMVALGDYYAGLFTNEEELADSLKQNADKAGEGLWRLPLPDFYKSMLKAEWGQIKNVGGRAAGATTAALFLSEFVDGPKWAHIDIAGPAFFNKSFRHFCTGGTGALVETLVHWLCEE